MPAQLDFPAGAVAVFGGSGGAGSEFCRSFAAAGCDVAFTYLTNAERARSLEAELAAYPVTVSAHRLDLADCDETETVFAAMAERHGTIHTVVYASGPRIDTIHIADTTPERFRAVVEGELLGFFHLVRAAVPYFRKRGGNIVACVTCANYRMVANDGQSAVPKGGIESLVRQIAREEGDNGIRANAVALGWFDLGQATMDRTERSNLSQKGGEEMAEFMTRQIVLGHRPGTGRELAPAVLFMASKQASYITGQTLVVDGGASV